MKLLGPKFKQIVPPLKGLEFNDAAYPALPRWANIVPPCGLHLLRSKIPAARHLGMRFHTVMLDTPTATNPNSSRALPSCGQRLRRHFDYPTLLQTQNAVALTRKPEIVSNDERGQTIVAM